MRSNVVFSSIMLQSCLFNLSRSFQIFPDGEVMTTFLFGCQARSRFHKNFSISKGQRDPWMILAHSCTTGRRCILYGSQFSALLACLQDPFSIKWHQQMTCKESVPSYKRVLMDWCMPRHLVGLFWHQPVLLQPGSIWIRRRQKFNAKIRPSDISWECY